MKRERVFVQLGADAESVDACNNDGASFEVLAKIQIYVSDDRAARMAAAKQLMSAAVAMYGATDDGACMLSLQLLGSVCLEPKTVAKFDALKRAEEAISDTPP